MDIDENMLMRITPRARLKTLVVNVNDHCNLNCCGCDHFSCISNEKTYDADGILRDLTRMRELIGDQVNLISVMGGEPLLYEDLAKVLQGTRERFENTDIWLSTNGVLILQMSEDLWTSLHENRIVINVTKYPIPLDFEAMENKALDKGVILQYYHGGLTEKTMGHYPLDLEGNQDPSDSFIHCFHANNTCNMLKEGRLYPCTIAPCIPIFNERFNQNIPLTEYDGIDIYKTRDRVELFRRLAEPMPICRFCKTRERSFGHSWKKSAGVIEEWT